MLDFIMHNYVEDGMDLKSPHHLFCATAAEMTAIKDDPNINLVVSPLIWTEQAQDYIANISLAGNLVPQINGTSRSLGALEVDAQTSNVKYIKLPEAPERDFFIQDCEKFARDFLRATNMSAVRAEIFSQISRQQEDVHQDAASFIGYVPIIGNRVNHFSQRPKSQRTHVEACKRKPVSKGFLKVTQIELGQLAIWTGFEGPAKVRGPSYYYSAPSCQKIPRLFLRLTPMAGPR